MSAASFADPLTERLVAFVRGIGIDVRTATLPEKTVLPGLDIRHGAILVDETRMTHPAISCTRPAISPSPIPPNAMRRSCRRPRPTR